ncbi:MAG: hypothetical protein FH753_08600 [Firmicutes bacterium]|nr:hypothetical protein [Bacillota bacterium]
MKKIQKYISISAIIITILLFVGVHAYNQLQIQTKTFTEKWGRGLEVGKATINNTPKMSFVDNKILTTTFAKGGKINYYLTTKDGKLLTKGISTPEGFNKNDVDNIELIDNKMYYSKENKLYLSSFNENKFTKPKIVLKGISDFRLNKVGNKNYIVTYNNKHIELYLLNNNKLKKEMTLENKWSLKDIRFKNINGEKYLFLVNETKDFDIEYYGCKIKNNKITQVELLNTSIMLGNYELGKFNIKEHNGNVNICQSVTKVDKGQIGTYFVLVITDTDLKVKVDKKIISARLEKVDRLGQEVYLTKEDSGVYILSSGINLANTYSSSPDIFKGLVNEDGSIGNITFLSNTLKYSKNLSILDSKAGKYLSWLDIKDGQYSLFINSENEEFIENSTKYYKKDYFRAIITAVSTPLFILPYIPFKGYRFIVYSLIAMLAAGYIMKKLDVRDDKKIFGIFAIIYLIISVIVFKDTFYVTKTFMLPGFLKGRYSPYLVAVLLNIIAGTLTYLVYKAKKNYHFIAYLAIFAMLHVYLSTLLYMPFMFKL